MFSLIVDMLVLVFHHENCICLFILINGISYIDVVFKKRKYTKQNLDGLHDKAIEVYERILADKPNHGLALYNLGLSKYELNDIRKACIYIDRSLKLGINEARDFVRDHCRW